MTDQTQSEIESGLSSQEGQIVMFGTRWCGDCRRSRMVLEEMGISYQYVDIEQVPEAAEYVIRVNNGYRSVPLLVFPDGETLTEPRRDVLLKKLECYRQLE